MANRDLPTLEDMREAIRELRADRDAMRVTIEKYNRIYGIVGYDDLFIPLSVGTLRPAAAAPTWAVFRNNVYRYTFAINDVIALPTQEFVHGYKEGTTFELHAHIATNGVDITDRYVRYRLEYTYANVAAAFPATVQLNSADFLIPANTATHTHLYVSIGTITDTALRIGSNIDMEFSRIALAGAGAAPTNAPFVGMVGIHIEKDSIGSRQRRTK